MIYSLIFGWDCASKFNLHFVKKSYHSDSAFGNYLEFSINPLSDKIVIPGLKSYF